MDGFKYLENACVGYGCKLYNVGQGCLVSYTLYFIHAYPVSHVLGIGATSKASGITMHDIPRVQMVSLN